MIVRRRRFVLDGKPVLLSTSYLPAALVAGSAITQPDTGAGGTYARLAELGAAPVRFREASAHAARRAAYSGISAMGALLGVHLRRARHEALLPAVELGEPGTDQVAAGQA